jgi:hypothetical protein
LPDVTKLLEGFGNAVLLGDAVWLVLGATLVLGDTTTTGIGPASSKATPASNTGGGIRLPDVTKLLVGLGASGIGVVSNTVALGGGIKLPEVTIVFEGFGGTVTLGGGIRLPEVTKLVPGPGTLAVGTVFAEGAVFAEVSVVAVTCAFKLVFVSRSEEAPQAGTKLTAATPTAARSSLRVCNLRGLGS